MSARSLFIRTFIFAAIVTLAFDWMFLWPAALFGSCAWRWSRGCTTQEMAAGIDQFKANLLHEGK